MHVLLLLVAAWCAHADAFFSAYDAYRNKDIEYPKCCPPGQYLRYETGNSTLLCYEDPTVNLQINADSLANYTDNCAEKCVDFLVHEGTKKLILPNCDSGSYAEFANFIKYPKCCPLGHVYDPVEHKCARNAKFGFDKRPGVFVKVDLSHCRSSDIALVDYLDVKNVSIDADKGITLDNGRVFEYEKYCYDMTAEGRNVVRACENYSTSCMQNFDDPGVRCLKKCCPDGQIYLNGAKCAPIYKYGMNISGSERIKNNDDYKFGIIQVDKTRKYMADEYKHKFFVDKLGNLHVRENNNWKLYSSQQAIYCTEYVQMNGVARSHFFLFVNPTEGAMERVKFDLSAVILSISCVFSLLTVICYMLLPDMHNLYGKSIMMYCTILALGCALLAFAQFEYGGLSAQACATIGFLIQFAFLASFTWLNVICFDMWMAFGKMRVKSLTNKRKEWKRFMYYNIYGWTVPTVITLTTFAFYKTKCLPDYLVPHIGNIKCFFDKMEGNYDHFIFFIFPLTFLIVCNSVMFVKTIMYCFKVKDQINKMKSSPSNDKAKRSKKFHGDMEKLMMLLKLCLIMGISWLFEVVSSIFSFKRYQTTEIIETIWDTFNCLQGVFIFCIFILKKNVLKSLRIKICGAAIGRKTSVSSTTMSSLHSTVRHKEAVNGRKTSEVRISAT